MHPTDNISIEYQEELLKDVFKLLRSLFDESERAAVILAAARLDADLEALLKHLLHPFPNGSDPMFDGDRLLGTFSAKIAMAHRLGAINGDFEHALQLIRKIRNDFAHQLESESLSSPKQKARLDTLVRWVGGSDMFRVGLKAFSDEVKSTEHLKFILAAVYLSVGLQTGLKTLKRVNVGVPLDTVLSTPNR